MKIFDEPHLLSQILLITFCICIVSGFYYVIHFIDDHLSVGQVWLTSDVKLRSSQSTFSNVPIPGLNIEDQFTLYGYDSRSLQ